MGRPKGGDNQARKKLIQAAGRNFRVGGFGGAGVDGLAKEAGLTSGAFYAHFSSKAEVFRLALVDGLKVLQNAVETFQQQHGRLWLEPFVDFYLGERMVVDLRDACALPTLSSDAARADELTRNAYQQSVSALVAQIASGFQGPRTQERAWTLLAILSGASVMARAMTDPAIRQQLLLSAAKSAKAV